MPIRCALFLSSAVVIAGAAAAQETGTVPTEQSPPARSAAATGEGPLPEVVVTAQKRAERIQDVPIAIRAVTGDQLVSGGISNIAGLTRAAPDLQIDTQTIFTVLTIRGVSSRDIFIANDSAVSLRRVGAFVRNLEDEVVISSASFLGGGIDLWNINFGPRRTYGVQAGVKF